MKLYKDTIILYDPYPRVFDFRDFTRIFFEKGTHKKWI